ncbi:MAG: thiamine-phosphate kinase [Thiotrichales bacterium]|jgi:thiamine-monophosphate kinase|nr:thiamine-phosphate kinase [Thiotrichales bacterium]MBT4653856.1 thiamine-phosphate kinase [Thiotrichales bacterium]MBT5500476.1 thiamine-phosphate kinase [Thiotrichales bacterium]MBT5983614.1 thiamine-phosphate kinase [Thiotrichales bacterium]MBT6770883.1 thiamine-phosphate kinase [Thiotrichales bacterium]
MNEFDLIKSYFNWPLSDPSIELGVGDDAALFQIDSDCQLVTSTDTLSEGVHFFKDAHPGDIAYKSLAVNLSDIAAMGAQAKCFTLSLTLPKLDESWLQAFSDSLREASEFFNVSLIGGDTTKGPLNITITIMGTVKKSKAIKRSGAKNGDDIYVSGDLGRAALCLKKINEGSQPSTTELNKLNKPVPRLSLGSALKNIASSCIDISDGLEQDLSHILSASKVGAIIDSNNLPLSDTVKEYIKSTQDWGLPLCGGDDYELCFTSDKSNQSEIKKLSENLKVRITKIGVINNSLNLNIKGYDGLSKSFKHF